LLPGRCVLATGKKKREAGDDAKACPREQCGHALTLDHDGPASVSDFAAQVKPGGSRPAKRKSRKLDIAGAPAYHAGA